MTTKPDAQRAVVVAGDVVTAYGRGMDALWLGLLSGESAAKPVEHFSTKAFAYHHAACVSGLVSDSADSRIMQLLNPLLANILGAVDEETLLILATTTGEIDLLERAIDTQTGRAAESLLQHLLDKTASLCGTEKKLLLSSACASSTAAIAHAAALIQSGREERVLVVACDEVSEFVFSGFSALRALDRLPAKPFDKNRGGLLLGEGAGYMLMMSETCARRENRLSMGEVIGWGLSNDANHMTGPSRTGHGLKQAVEHAFNVADIAPDDAGFICAHGTGTVYNDAMEMHAFRSFFTTPKPLYSIKGGTGHTMGAAGLIETLTVFRALHEGCVPRTVGLIDVDPLAEGWASINETSCNVSIALTTNSGFGGINAALLLS